MTAKNSRSLVKQSERHKMGTQLVGMGMFVIVVVVVVVVVAVKAILMLR